MYAFIKICMEAELNQEEILESNGISLKDFFTMNDYAKLEKLSMFQKINANIINVMQKNYN